MSSMLQASCKLQATAAKMGSLRVQPTIKPCERIKIWQETTIPQSLLKVGSQVPIAVKLLNWCLWFFFKFGHYLSSDLEHS